MRDGLLVGSEIFVVGQYVVGSAETADLRLNDVSIRSHHATLFFKNGRVAIQDNASGTLQVNGHRITACEIRSIDEIVIGPFALKTRVMNQKPQDNVRPAPAVAALLATQPGSARPPSIAPPVAPPPLRPMSSGRSDIVNMPSTTVASARRLAEAPEAAALPSQPSPVPARPPVGRALHLISPPPAVEPLPIPPPVPSSEPRRAAVSHTPSVVVSPAVATPDVRHQAKSKASPSRAGKPRAPTPHVTGKESPPRLLVQLCWGDTKQKVTSFRKSGRKGFSLAAEDVRQLELGSEPLRLARHKRKGEFQIFVPSGASIERRQPDGEFHPAEVDSEHSLTLSPGDTARLCGRGELHLELAVVTSFRRPFTNPLARVPWLLVATVLLVGGLFGAFAYRVVTMPVEPNFSDPKLSAVAVRLFAPKPEEKKKVEEKVKALKEKAKKAEEKKESKVEKVLPKAVATDTKKALKSVEKLIAAPAMKELLSAMDKLPAGGPGAKNAKEYKLSGLIGNQPVAAAGLGSFGIGAGGAGSGIKGSELLRGKLGIGSLGAGNVGKGKVGGTVGNAVARSVSAQGTIDKEAVAKVINAHLHEVSSCYERALLKEPGLAGKIVLEWNISLTGTVASARTKSSTMRSASVETCILGVLKQWKFPPAKGAGVVVSYPFMFNSVGY
jgi:Inner membrane component of T3SS, cytoplasmic domain